MPHKFENITYPSLNYCIPPNPGVSITVVVQQYAMHIMVFVELLYKSKAFETVWQRCNFYKPNFLE